MFAPPRAIPELETPRLLLRPWREEDLDAQARCYPRSAIGT